MENTGIPIAYQISDDTGRFFHPYFGVRHSRADIPETQEILKFEMENLDYGVKNEFIKCKLSKEAERILHEILGTSDGRREVDMGNYYRARDIPSMENTAVTIMVWEN